MALTGSQKAVIGFLVVVAAIALAAFIISILHWFDVITHDDEDAALNRTEVENIIQSSLQEGDNIITEALEDHFADIDHTHPEFAAEIPRATSLDAFLIPTAIGSSVVQWSDTGGTGGIPPGMSDQLGVMDYVYIEGTYTGPNAHMFDNFNDLMTAVEAADPGPKRIWLYDPSDAPGLGTVNIDKKTAATAGVAPTTMDEVYDLTGCTLMCKRVTTVNLANGVYFKGLELMYDGVQINYAGTGAPCMVWDRADLTDPTGTTINQMGRGLFLDNFSTVVCSGSQPFMQVRLNTNSNYQAAVISFGRGGGFPLTGSAAPLDVVSQTGGPLDNSGAYLSSDDRVWIQTVGTGWFLAPNTISTSDGFGQVSLEFFNTEGHINNNFGIPATAMPNLDPASWSRWTGSGPIAWYRMTGAQFYYRKFSRQTTGTVHNAAPMTLPLTSRNIRAGFQLGDTIFHYTATGGPGSPYTWVCQDEVLGTWVPVY